jgi:RNA polymerase sigma-70 factor (ECF subfamily)
MILPTQFYPAPEKYRSWAAREVSMKNWFLEIYHTYVNEIYAYLLARCGMDPQTAEDLTQETFMAVYKGLSRFRGLCSERTWVYQIARNKLTDHYRGIYHKAMELMSLDDERALDIADEQENIEILLSYLHESQRVAACMQSMPEHYRMTLLLKYVEELSVKDIARIANKNDKSIENTLRRAKAMFAKRYLALEQEDCSNETK